jgi:hypothetical protein
VLIHQLLVVDFLTNGRVDEFLLQLRMHVQLHERHLDDPLLLIGTLGLFELLKEILAFCVVVPKHVRDRSDDLRFGVHG